MKQTIIKHLNRVNRLVLVGILLSANVLGILVTAPRQKAEAAIALNFSLLGTHPGAAAQPTNAGKTINKLQVFDGKLFAAYGDYNANTGPISINPFDLSNGSFDGEVLSVTSESLGNWKIINNKLYTTTIDATCSGSCPSGYAVGDTSGNWSVQTPFSAEHIFDIETLSGTDLWLFGGSTDTAYAWRSTDGGANWSVAQTNNRNPDDGDDSERYYWGKAVDGKMFMQADVYTQPADAQIYDGSNWTTGTAEKICENGNGSQGANPVSLNGKIICTSSNRLFIYNATTNTRESSYEIDGDKCASIRDLQVVNGVLNALCVAGDNAASLFRSTDLEVWQELSGLPSSATSFTVDSDTNKVYVGTADSKLYAASMPPADTIPPTISITSPTAGSTKQYLGLTSSASDNVQLTKVEYYLDDQLISTSRQSPYNGSWANRFGETEWEQPAGQYTLAAKAYDFDGNITTSAPVLINIEEPDLWPDSLPGVGSLVTRAANGDLWGVDVRGILTGQTPIQFVKFDPVTEETTYYPVPEEASPGFPAISNKLTIAPNGSLWYLNCEDQKIVNYFPTTEVVEVYEFDRVCGDGFGNLVLAADGSVYNAPLGSETINKIDSEGNISSINVSDDREVFAIGLSQDGQVILSIVEYNEDNDPIGALATLDQNGVIADYFTPNNDPQSNIFGEGLLMDGSGTTWISGVGEKEQDGFYLASVSAEGEVTRFDVPAGVAGRVMTMQLGADGDFYAMLSNGQIARVTASGQFSLYHVLTPGDPDVLGPEAVVINQGYLGYYVGSLVADTDGTLWVDDGFGGRLLRILVTDSSGPTDPGSPNSSTLTNPETSTPVLLETPEGTELTCSSAAKESAQSVTDPAYDYPVGLANFCFTTDNVDNQVSLTFVTNLKQSEVVARKYKSSNSSYSNIAGAQITDTTYQNQHALMLTYTITDNGALDLDPATGSIKDPVGLARLTVGVPNTGIGTITANIAGIKPRLPGSSEAYLMLQ